LRERSKKSVEVFVGSRDRCPPAEVEESAGRVEGGRAGRLLPVDFCPGPSLGHYESAFYLFGGGQRGQSGAPTNLGLVAIHNEDYTEAERQLREALRLDPSFIDALGNLGSMYFKQKKFDAAIQQYARISSICPKNPEALSEMARAFHEQVTHPQTEACLRRAVELEPASVEFRFRLAESQ
jgi:tetratricopeptide (TPR) repeat protein